MQQAMAGARASTDLSNTVIAARAPAIGEPQGQVDPGQRRVEDMPVVKCKGCGDNLARLISRSEVS